MRAAPTRYENFTAKPAQGTRLEFFVEAFAILFGPPTLFPESRVFWISDLGRRILRECAAERLADIGIDKSRHTEPKIAERIEDQASRDLVMIVTAEAARHVFTGSKIQRKHISTPSLSVRHLRFDFLPWSTGTDEGRAVPKSRSIEKTRWWWWWIGSRSRSSCDRQLRSAHEPITRAGLGHQRSWPLIFVVHARCVEFIGLLIVSCMKQGIVGNFASSRRGAGSVDP